MASNQDQCALDEHGNLKDVNDIHWYHSESENIPIQPFNVCSSLQCKKSWLEHVADALRKKSTGRSTNGIR